MEETTRTRRGAALRVDAVVLPIEGGQLFACKAAFHFNVFLDDYPILLRWNTLQLVP